jgi:hypothetical protein
VHDSLIQYIWEGRDRKPQHAEREVPTATSTVEAAFAVISK